MMHPKRVVIPASEFDLYDNLVDIHFKSSNPDIHHYTLIVPTSRKKRKNNRCPIITYGISTNVQFQFLPTKHSEVDAIGKIKHRRKNPESVDLIVVRFSKTGILGDSRPCYHCIDFMMKSRLNIKYIYYSLATGVIVRERLSEMLKSDKTYVSSGMKQNLCR